MRLFIAEKPKVARAIADELGIKKKGEGFIDCGDDVVTWCFGHMLELAEPDIYTSDDVPTAKSGKKIWRSEDLPIFPDEWLLLPKSDAKKQISTIKNFLSKADSVVNAGDPDREGQLLVDELLHYFDYKKPVYRYWANAIDSASVKKAINNISDNDDYKGMALAAEGRSKADWLIGMNLSRAFTLSAKRSGSGALLTVGRVQTPTLGIVVERDRSIEAFKSIPFYKIVAPVKHENGAFQATWIAKDTQEGLDEEGRLIDADVATQIVEKLTGIEGVIATHEQKTKKKYHPLSFSLSALTTKACKKFACSAEDVLNACQALYEKHKLTTYPRTDCAYLPESQFKEVPDVLESVAAVNPDWQSLIDKTDVGIKSKTWNDKKVTAHHGIIPTLHKGDISALTALEEKIYTLIVMNYIAQFYPIHEYLDTNVVVEADDEALKARASVVTVAGWKAVFDDTDGEQENSDDESNDKLPKMTQGDSVTLGEVERKDQKTRPPKRFTEGTLVAAMVNIHRFVTDPKHKQMLKEGDGIGTEATRASIITELQRREYLEKKGKNIVSTKFGRSVYDALPSLVKSPVLTSLYERMLKGVESGDATLEDFMEKQQKYVVDQINASEKGEVKIQGYSGKTVEISKKYLCKSCGKGLIRRKGKKGYWWGCSGYPECETTYLDVKGKPKYS